jgi:tetratricopeptide (TPR) repeat protein
MFPAIFLCCALIGQNGTSAASRPADLAAYESASAKAGKDADAHVQLALWCEARGLTAERMKHLASAVAADPAHALARGLIGLVSYQGKWEHPEAVAQQIENDPAHKDLVREYLDRRVKAETTPAAQLKLAAWCEKKGLTAQALAHYNEVIRLDPSRADVWRHLGYRKHGNRWLKAEEIAAQEQEAGRQKVADKRWKPVLAKLRADLESAYPAKVARAEQRLAEVTDPRAVPMIWAHFVRGSERRELTAVQILGQIDGSSAANCLAAMAVFSPRAEVREQATAALTRYDPRETVEALIDVLRKPFRYEVRPGATPGSPGELFVEGEQYNIRRIYENQNVVPALWGGRLFSPSVSFDPFRADSLPMTTAGQPFLILTQNMGVRPGAGDVGELRPQPDETAAGLLRRSDMGVRPRYVGELRVQPDETTAGLRRRLRVDVRAIEAVNAGINRLNGRALSVLTAITAKDLGADPEQWKRWWTDRLGYAYQPSQSESKPTYTTFVTEPLPPQYTHHACFGAGTLVRTVDGPRKIESVAVGDRVLSQNTATGSLEFRPVLAVYHNKPAATLRLSIGGDPVVATGIHRFWKAGKGWAMARELKAGDRVRMVGGVSEIQSITQDAVQPVFNLEVAENRDYFVGKAGMLVHDNSFVQPVLEPFDRQPDLAALAPATEGN